MTRRTAKAILALVLAALTLAAVTYSVIAVSPRGLILVLWSTSWTAGGYGLIRRGPRGPGPGAAVTASPGRCSVSLDGGVAEFVLAGRRPATVAHDQGRLRGTTCRSQTPRTRSVRSCSSTSKSGGKAERFKLADEARPAGSRRRAGPRSDLERLVRARSPRAPTRWRWPAATARRSSRPSPPSVASPTRASLRGPELFRARPRGRSR